MFGCPSPSPVILAGSIERALQEAAEQGQTAGAHVSALLTAAVQQRGDDEARAALSALLQAQCDALQQARVCISHLSTPLKWQASSEMSGCEARS